MTIYKYQRVITPGPDGTTLYFKNTDANDALELAELDGWWYVFVPDDVTAPVQPKSIQWQVVVLTPELREQIKARSSACKLIYNEMQQRIRNKYPIEEEMYFSRIGIGVALGVYAFQPGEQDALLAYGDFVESVRRWGALERKKIGL